MGRCIADRRRKDTHSETNHWESVAISDSLKRSKVNANVILRCSLYVFGCGLIRTIVICLGEVLEAQAQGYFVVLTHMIGAISPSVSRITDDSSPAGFINPRKVDWWGIAVGLQIALGTLGGATLGTFR